MIRRLQTLPAAADAEDGSLYLEINSNGRILRRLLKDYRLSAFFDITVADLGEGHRGYAGAGYDGLGSNYAVNAGGSSQFSGIGAISEQYRSFASATFTRVGTYTISNQIQGLGSHGTNLYFVRDLGTTSRVDGFNPANGTSILTSTALSENNPQGFTILGGIGYFYGNNNNDFYAYNISTDTVTQLTSSPTLTLVLGLAHDGTNVFVIYRTTTTSPHQVFIGQVNTSNGNVSNIQRLTGFNASDSEDRANSFTALGNTLYVGTIDNTDTSDPYLYSVNPSNGNLTEIGAISPATARIQHAAELGGNIYGWNIDDRGIYSASVAMGNRWVATFPTTTTEVAADETTLKLFTQRGGTEIELTKDDTITDALVFASGYDGASAHTINVGDTPEWALYNSNDEQLYEGSVEAIYSELAAA